MMVKKIVLLILVSLMFLLLLPLAAEDKSLNFTTEEQDWLQNHKSIPVLATLTAPPYSSLNEKGELVGMLTDIFARLESLMGIEFEYEVVDYSAVVDHVIQKDRPVITSFDPLDYPAYKESYFKSQNLAFMPFGLYAEKDSDMAKNGISAVHGKRVAIIKGWDLSHPALQELLPCTFVFGNNPEDLINLVLNNEADAIYDLVGALDYHLFWKSVSSIKLIHISNQGLIQNILITKEWSDFYSILTKALAAFTQEDFTALHKKWFNQHDSPRYNLLTSILTQDERDFLAEHRKIRVGSDPNWAPIEARNSSGEFYGLSIDYLKIIESYIGVNFEIDKTSSWQELIEKSKTGGIDVFSAVSPTQKREKFLNITSPLISFPIKVYGRTESGYIGDLSELANVKVAVVQGYATEDLLRKDYPGLNLLPVPNTETGLRSLQKKRVDAFVGSLFTVSYEISRLGLSNVKVIGDTEYNYDLGLGVRKDWPLMASILQKAINEIPVQEKERIYQQWIPLTVDAQFDYSLLIKYLIPVIMVFFIIIIWNWTLKKLVNKRTGELIASASRLEEAEKLALLGHWEQIAGEEKMIWSSTLYDILEISQNLNTPGFDLFIKQFHKNDKNRFMEKYTLLCERREPFSENFRLLLRGGEIKTVHIQCHIGEEGTKNSRKLLGTLQDISVQVRTTEELRVSEERYHLLSDLNMEGIAIHQNGVMLEVNRAFCNIFGYEENDLLDSNIMSLAMNSSSADKMREFITEGFEGIYEVTGKHKEGREIYLEIQSRNFIYNGKNCRCTIVRDITSLKTTQDKLRQSEKMQAIGQLAGGIAHDFNNMLGGIIGGSELLSQYLEDIPEASEINNMILSSAERAGELTNQLLSFSRKQPSNSHIFNVHSCLGDAINLFKRTFDKRIQIIEELKAEIHDIAGDQPLLQSAFMNLGVNASHAMPGGGKLRISTSVVSLNEAYCEESVFDLTPGEYIEIEFMDNGSGIDPDNMEKIFEPFFTTKEQGQGTGLGLSAVYGTIRQHHGAINAYSETGKGTAFHILLPLVSGEVTLEKKPLNKSYYGSGLILIADDEKIMRFTAKKILTEHGYDVLTAENGLEAVSVYRENMEKVDLIILDMIMPVMNGEDSFKEIKKINPRARVILSSGFPKDVDIKEMKKNGLIGFIKKPYRSRNLTQIVHEAIK